MISMTPAHRRVDSAGFNPGRARGGLGRPEGESPFMYSFSAPSSFRLAIEKKIHICICISTRKRVLAAKADRKQRASHNLGVSLCPTQPGTTRSGGGVHSPDAAPSGTRKALNGHICVWPDLARPGRADCTCNHPEDDCEVLGKIWVKASIRTGQCCRLSQATARRSDERCTPPGCVAQVIMCDGSPL